MRISQIPQLKNSDWPLYGGSMQRDNVALSAVIPPLTRVWEYDANAGYTPYAAVAESDFVFIGNLKGEVHVVKITDGKKVFLHQFGSAIYGSPVIDGQILYAALSKDEKSLKAFNLSSGKTMWEAELGGIETSPLLVGDKLYVVTLAGELYCVNKITGAAIWSYRDPDETVIAQVHSSPVSDGSVIAYCRDDGAIFAINAESGMLKWRAKARKSIIATPSIRGGTLYVGALDSVFYAFDLSTGVVLWEQTLDGRIFASQAVGEENIYAGTAGGTIYCLNRVTGKINWQYEAQAAIGAAPVISGNIVYAGSLDKTLYAFDCISGKLVWSWKSEGRIKTTPLIHQGYLILLQDDRTITAFKEGVDQP
jgi:outer membrane protein assembly factor BamB